MNFYNNMIIIENEFQILENDFNTKNIFYI